MLDIKKIRADFPILSREVNGHPLIYLDSAATAQKPRQVLAAIDNYFEKHNANVHRGVHTLSVEATEMMDDAREKIAKFIGARTEEVIFVRNTTEAINLVVYSWGEENIKEGDEILVTLMEHHSNLVPWQELARRKGATLKIINVKKDGILDLDNLRELLNVKVKLVAFTAVSNVLGTINPIQEIASRIRNQELGTKVLVDGAQAVPQMPVDVRDLGVDFYVFSGHKMYGPMGIGGLWVRREILEKMGPFMTGGGTISEVHTAGTIFGELPDRFDAGTPNVAGAVGLAAAVEYLEKIGMHNIRQHAEQLTQYALNELKSVKGVKIYGPMDIEKRAGLVAFTLEGVHAHDVAQILDSEGIAVRSGHHCTMPMHEKLGLVATVRASFGVYNTKEEVDRLVEGLHKVKEVFGG